MPCTVGCPGIFLPIYYILYYTNDLSITVSVFTCMRHILNTSILKSLYFGRLSLFIFGQYFNSRVTEISFISNLIYFLFLYYYACEIRFCLFISLIRYLLDDCSPGVFICLLWHMFIPFIVGCHVFIMAYTPQNLTLLVLHTLFN